MPVSYSFDDRVAIIRMQGCDSVSDLEETILAGSPTPTGRPRWS